MPVTPFNESPPIISSQSIVNSGSIDTSAFNHLRQGVSIRNPRDFFDGTLPRFNYIVDDLVLEQSSLGNPALHNVGTPHEDVPGYNLELVADESQSPLHPAEVDAALNDPFVRSGIIEPFELRENISRKSMYERAITGIRAQRMAGNDDTFGGADEVVHVNEQSVLRPFEDSQETFGVSVQGYTTPIQPTNTPFDDETVDAASVYKSDVLGSDFAATMSLLYVDVSGSFVGDGMGVGHEGHYVEYKGFGFDYASRTNAKIQPNVDRPSLTLDSLAFGDRQRYASRGFIRQLDATLPTRPLTLRSSDERRLGNFGLPFDDRKTMVFTSSAEFDVGRSLAGGYSYLSEFESVSDDPTSGSVKQYPFVGQTTYDVFNGGADYDPEVTTVGSARPGMGDNWLISEDIPREIHAHVAFDETRVYDDRDDERYVSSSLDSAALDGFSAPLRSKTQIVIDLPGAMKEVYFTTGSAGGEVESGLVYFNKDLARWESIATSSVDYLDDDATVRGASALAFMPSDMTTQTNSMSFLQSGQPTTDAGFPFASKFDATSSMVFNASDYIAHPFLVDSCVVEAQLIFSPVLGLTATMAPRVQQFFIMNQYDANGPDVTIHLAGTNSTSGSVTHTVDKIKDIVATGFISRADPTWDNFWAHERDLTIEIDEAAALVGHSGSYTFPFRPGANPVIGTNDQDPTFCARQRFVRSSDRVAEKNVFGGVQNALLTAPRLYSQSVPHAVSSTYVEIIPAITELIPSASLLPASYLLMPDDKLIFGFANQSLSISSVYDDALIAEESVSIGSCRVRLVGSFVRDNKEHHFGLNQQMNSETVFESIGDAATLDQFVLEQPLLYSGTYMDDMVEGAFADGNRSVIASHVTVQNCRSASLNYSAKLIDTDEYVYDSMLPNPVRYHEANGATINAVGTSHGAIFVGIPSETYASTDVDNIWARAFPFESRYAGLPRLYNVASTDIKASNGQNVTWVYMSGSTVSLPSPPGAGAFGTTLALIESDTQKFAFNKPIARNAIYRFYFGTGPRVEYGGLPGGQLRVPGLNWALKPRPHGMKYGVYSPQPVRSSAQFRADQYGQFRDMLEQRLYTRVFDDGAKQLLGSAVVAVFSASIDQSSNLSVHATSSLPYFEDVVRN